MKLHLIAALSAAVAVGCGPMNRVHEPALRAPSQASAHGAGAPGVSAAGKFVLYPAGVNGEKAKLGDFVYELKVLRHDLSALAEGTVVTATYGMPGMPEMGQTEAELTRQADGSYRMAVFYSMPGLWRIDIRIEEGQSRDGYAIDETLQ